MCDAWSRFYKNKGSSAMVLNYLVSELNIDNLGYIKQSTLDEELKNLSKRYWLPSYIERYVSDNVTARTGLNVKYANCDFCGELDVIYTRENAGVNELKSLCSPNCKKYSRIFNRCDKSFFKGIRKEYKASKMTVLLFALQKRAKILKNLKRSK